MDISIIIPVYNLENYISECLESVKNLNLNYEVIVVNDGSTDKSLELINKFTSKYDGNISVITKGNGGPSSARNAGIQCATGNYIFFLDGDDLINNTSFELFVHDVIRDGVDIGFADYKYLINGELKPNNETKHRRSVTHRLYEFLDGITYGELVFDKKTDFINSEACFLLIRKSFLTENKIEFKEGILLEDTLFTISCLMVAQKVKYYDYPFYNYRTRTGSTMHSQNSKTITKRIVDKGIIALELFRLKEHNHVSATFVDSLIIDLLLVSAMHFKKKSAIINFTIRNCKKLTFRARMRVALYKVLSLRYTTVDHPI